MAAFRNPWCSVEGPVSAGGVRISVVLEKRRDPVAALRVRSWERAPDVDRVAEAAGVLKSARYPLACWQTSRVGRSAPRPTLAWCCRSPSCLRQVTDTRWLRCPHRSCWRGAPCPRWQCSGNRSCWRRAPEAAPRCGFRSCCRWRRKPGGSIVGAGRIGGRPIPLAVLDKPVVLGESAEAPLAVLDKPVVLEERARSPVAVLA